MRTSFVSAAFLAFASSVFAQTSGFDAITAPAKDQTLTVGSTFDIIWEPNSVTGTVSIVLLEGASPSTLELGPTLASGVTNSAGKFAWTIPASVGDFATYGIKIQLDSDPSTFQYSNPFHISGGSSASASSKSTSASATKSSSASGSATKSGSASATSTKTVLLSTGTAYTSTATVAPTHNSTIVSTTAAPVTTKSASNVTVSTTLIVTPSSSALTSATAPTTTPAIQTSSPNAAGANMARGGLAVLGGILIALLM